MPRYVSNIYFPAPNVKIMLEGRWTKAVHGVDGISSAIQTGYNRVMSRFSKKLLYALRHAIDSGGPDGLHWEQQSPSTQRTYKSHGWEVGKPWYRTGLVYRSLGLYNYGKRVYIGLPSNIRTPRGLTLVQLARLLETGTRETTENHPGIPARPLFAPTLKSIGGTPALKKEIIKSIRSELYKLGFNSNQVKM